MFQRKGTGCVATLVSAVVVVLWSFKILYGV